MSLSKDLLAQAEFLVMLDRGKPKQVNLRRAVSAAYYAMFHLLTAEAALRMTPRIPARLAPKVARSLSHAEMKEVCRAVSSGNAAASLKLMLPQPIAPELRDFARLFIGMQEARHSADYDLTATFSRSATLKLVREVKAAFVDWTKVRLSDEATVFLAALLFAKRWDR